MQKQNKRDQILSVATSLFDEYGFHDTRLEDISAALGKGKTSISYHFKTKEALLDAACEKGVEYTSQELKAANAQKNGLEKILYFIRHRANAHADALAGRRPPLTLLSVPHDIDNISNSEMAAQRHQQTLAIADFLQGGCDDGSITISSIDATAFLIMNILFEIPRWLNEIPNARHQSAIDGLCDILRNGVAMAPDHRSQASISLPVFNEYPAIFDRKVKNQLKRDALMRTGTRYLNDNGYRNLSLNDVAAELGVTRGTFYYYIKDKDALVESCFKRSCERIEKAIQSVNAIPRLNTLQKMEQALFALFEGHITNMDPLIRLNLLNLMEPEKRISIEIWLKKLGVELSSMLANAVIDGSARNVNIAALDKILIGILFSAGHWRLSASPFATNWQASADTTKAAQYYFEAIICGLSAAKQDQN